MWFLRSLLLLSVLSFFTSCSSSGPKKTVNVETADSEGPVGVDFDPEEIQGFYHAYNAVPATKEIDFNASFSRGGYDYGDIRPGADNPEIRLVLTLENDADYPVRMDFRDGEIFEINFINRSGVATYRWSDDHYVMNVPHTLQFKAGETKRYVYVTRSRQIAKYLSSGQYTVRIRTNTLRNPMEIKTGFSVGN